MKKKLIVHIIVGFVVGVAVGLLIAWLGSLSDGTKLMEFSPVAKKIGRGGAVALQILVSGVLGCVSVTGMLLYEIDKWSLALATVVHLLAIIAFFSIASFSMGESPFLHLLFQRLVDGVDHPHSLVGGSGPRQERQGEQKNKASHQSALRRQRTGAAMR